MSNVPFTQITHLTSWLPPELGLLTGVFGPGTLQ